MTRCHGAEKYHSIGPDKMADFPATSTYFELIDILWRDIGILEARAVALEPKPKCPTCNGTGTTLYIGKVGEGGEFRACPDCDWPQAVYDNSDPVAPDASK